MNQIAHDIDNKNRTDDVKIVENLNFSSMLLSDEVLQGLLQNGFKKPSPIQVKAIPMGRCGYDLIIQAKSGTGKTAVFGIIALEMIDVNKNQIQVLILAPTREIAVQIQDVLRSIGVNIDGLKVEYFIGGTPIKEDVEKLKNCHIAVGAPGRMKHLIKDGHMKIDSIKLFVLDEVDKLLTLSQQSDINFIYNKLKNTKQVIASSATYPGDIKDIISKYMQTPFIIDLHQDVPVLLGIRQFVTTVKSHMNVVQQMALRTEALIRIFQTVSFTQCIVFCNYQNRAETLSNNLSRLGWPSIHLSAAQNQKTRLESILCLKEFKCRILTTTDLTARGIDAANVDLVINYEAPNDFETYLHRMGRAGRYGSNGLCISIISEGPDYQKFQNLIDKIQTKVLKFPKENVPADIWNCDLELFEKLTSNNPDSENICDTLKELSFEQNINETCSESVENIQNDVGILLKNLQKDEIVKESCKHINPNFENICDTSEELSDINTKNETEIQNDVEILLKNLQKEDEIVKESCKIFNPDTLLQMLSKGEPIFNKENDTPLNICTELNPSSIVNLLSDNIIPSSKKKSRNKKAKHSEKNCSDTEESNEQFENEAKIFQENSIAHKNIALYNITKVIVEDSVNEENIKSTESLLKIIEQEDSLEIQQKKSQIEFTDILNKLGLKTENTSNVGTWQVVNSAKNIEDNNCTCSEDLFCNIFDYTVGKTDQDWRTGICDCHKNEEIISTKIEENLLDFSEENDDEEYYEEDNYDEDIEEKNEEIMETEVVFDDDLFVKAFDYALNSEVNYEEIEETPYDEQDEENDACGYAASYSYDHLKTRNRKRKNKKNVEPDNNYESYFDECNDYLTQYGSSFTNVAQFESWFSQWEDNVRTIRDRIQKEIYEKKKLVPKQ